MKIAHVARRIVKEKWGGVEEHLIELATHQKKLDLHPQILSTMALANNEVDSIHDIDIKRFEYFYPYMPLSDEKKLIFDDRAGNPYSFSLYKHILRSNYSLVHSHTSGRLSFLAGKAAKKKKIPFVVTSHGGTFNVPQQEQQNLKNPYKSLFNYGKFIDIGMGYRQDFKISDGIIAINKFEFEKFSEQYPNKKVSLIPNAVDIQKYDVAIDRDFKGRYNLDPNAKLLLIVGRIDPQKNQLEVIKHLDALDDVNWNLLLIGPATNSKYYEEIQALLVEKNYINKVRVIPGLNPGHPDLVQAYLNADLFVFPSIHEPFGIVALEAMAAGCPVIANPVGGIPDFVVHEKTGYLYQENNTADLMDKISDLLLTDTSDIIRFAHNNVKANYSWEAIAKQTLDLYQSLL